MRRHEREITDIEEIIGIIRSSPFMTASFIDSSEPDFPYSVPLNFGFLYDENPDDGKKAGRISFWFHCAAEGRKISCIKSNPNVAVTFVSSSEIGIPEGADSEKACAWTCFFASVCARCSARIIEEREEKRRGLDAIMRKHGFPERTGREPFYSDAALDSVCVVRLDVLSVTGKAHWRR